MSQSTPHPLLSSSTSTDNIQVSPTPEVINTTTTADGSSTVESTNNGAAVITDTNNTAPPSISGSTATGTTTRTSTTTTISGTSSTSSPPPLFPPLANHGGAGVGTAGIAPPQVSITNAAAHNVHVHVPVQTTAHGHGNIPPPHHNHPNTVPSRTTSSIPPSSTSNSHIHTHQPPNPNPNQTAPVSTPRQIEEARRAVVASIGNMLDRELSGRANQLHSNNAAIEKQEREMARTLETFRKDNDKLAKLAADNTKKIKEIGNVQNWAELLEREFLILEETIRLANRRGDNENGDGDGDSGSWSGTGSGSYSGSASYAGSEAGDEDRKEEEEGVNGSKSVNMISSGDQDRMDLDGHQEDASMEGTSQPAEGAGATKVPVLLGKGKQKEGDIQLALAEAMETDLVIGAGDRGFEPGPSSSG